MFGISETAFRLIIKDWFLVYVFLVLTVTKYCPLM